jgi:Tannase-like family of unknown function (DUF6351)
VRRQIRYRRTAGESIATGTNKCRLKPLRKSDYHPVEFTDARRLGRAAARAQARHR